VVNEMEVYAWVGTHYILLKETNRNFGNRRQEYPYRPSIPLKTIK